jgi:hypothetical protein
MAMKQTSTVPESRLTERALRRHTKASANRPKLHALGHCASLAKDNSLPSTEILDTESVVQPEDIDQILMDSEQRRDLLATFRKDPEFFGIADPVKTPVRESIDLTDSRPPYARPCFIPRSAHHVLPELNAIHGNRTHSLLPTPGSQTTPPTIEAAADEPPQQSIDPDHVSARLIQTTSVQDDQLQNVFPSHFPQFQHVQNYGELGFYIDRSKYAICVGSGPVGDLHYGIIIVPLGEEHMLFRSEHVSREVFPATQQESSPRSIDEVQPRINNSASQLAARDSLVGPATVSKVRAPRKRTRNGREKSLRITKATKTRHPQTPAPIRRSRRLNADRHTT